ncbi:MAG: MazG family protein, partial [Frankia sp.]
MATRIVLLATGTHLPPGLLTAAAWDLLRAHPVLCGDAAHRQLADLTAAGIDVELITDPRDVTDHPEAADEADPREESGADAGRPARPTGPVLPGEPRAEQIAGLLGRRAAEAPAGTVVWLLGVDGEPALVAALTGLAAVTRDLALDPVAGSTDPPGAALLTAVTVMDRLRSPGGCPWDAEQTHESLAPYLIEEAYEALASIEAGNLSELREEIGDVLLQVLFHARLADEESSDEGGGWDVDDVASELVAKLVRRHPHVFGDVDVLGAADVEANWDAIKRLEKGRTSATDGVPLGQPALSLVAKLQSRAAKAGVPVDLMLGIPDVTPERLAAAFADLAAAAGRAPYEVDPDSIGALLVAAVVLARGAGVDPEAA